MNPYQFFSLALLQGYPLVKFYILCLYWSENATINFRSLCLKISFYNMFLNYWSCRLWLVYNKNDINNNFNEN